VHPLGITPPPMTADDVTIREASRAEGPADSVAMLPTQMTHFIACTSLVELALPIARNHARAT
jgi:hypothetical protein